VSLGCAGSATSVNQQQEELKLRGLLNLYAYAGRELGHSPHNEEEFKKFVQEKGGDVVSRLKLASVDDLFVSSRDGKPYVVQYAPPKSQTAGEVVAYEAEGANGKRLVCYETGEVRELNSEEFAALGL
jgi:hypothetical protein